MTDSPDEVAKLKQRLREVNAEWRDLSRQSGSEAKLSRMSELRTQRLDLMTEIFHCEQPDRKAG